MTHVADTLKSLSLHNNRIQYTYMLRAVCMLSLVVLGWSENKLTTLVFNVAEYSKLGVCVSLRLRGE